MKMTSRIKEARRALRVKLKLPLQCFSSQSQLEEKAVIRNISATGMMLAFPREVAFTPQERLVFQPLTSDVNFVPQEGRVVWTKEAPKTLVGIEFVAPSSEILNNLREKIQERISQMNANRIFINVGGGIVLLIFFFLGIEILYQEYTIHRIHRQSIRLLMALSNQQMALSYSLRARNRIQKKVIEEAYRELGITEGLLNETEAELERVSKLYSSTRNKLQKLQRTSGETEVISFQEENRILRQKVNNLKSQIGAASTTVERDMPLAKRLILYRKRIRNLKMQILSFKKAIRRTKIRMQKEKDAQLLRIGNRGYLIKDSKVTPVYRKSRVGGSFKVRVSLFE